MGVREGPAVDTSVPGKFFCVGKIESTLCVCEGVGVEGRGFWVEVMVCDALWRSDRCTNT